MESHLIKREEYFKQENFQLREKTENKLIINRKKYIYNILNKKTKVYNLKKQKFLFINIKDLDLPVEYLNFTIKDIVIFLYNFDPDISNQYH